MPDDRGVYSILRILAIVAASAGLMFGAAAPMPALTPVDVQEMHLSREDAARLDRIGDATEATHNRITQIGYGLLLAVGLLIRDKADVLKLASAFIKIPQAPAPEVPK